MDKKNIIGIGLITNFHFMKSNTLFTISYLLFYLSTIAQEKSLEWQNPIQEGFNIYGMKDFFSFSENDSLYIVGTEYKNPFKNHLGPYLYSSKYLNDWKKTIKLIDTDKISQAAWYKDVWAAPELFKFENEYYYTFNSRNNNVNAYQKLGFGIAKSKSLYGPYKVINTEKPTVLSNHGSIVFAPDKKPYLTYDMDGRIFIAEIDLKTATLKSKPTELLGPENLKKNYKYLDAANITKIDDTYHLLFSQFYAGYKVKVFHMTAKHPKGPWQWSQNNPIYTFLEAEADLNVKMPYPEQHGFAPPTQVIFSHDLVRGPNGNYLMIYHSSEKYSEPYLCIEPVQIKTDGQLILKNPKKSNQKLIIDEK